MRWALGAPGIARDPSIQKIEDLAGKTVALLQYTPSHGMLIDAIDNASLTARAKKQIKPIFIKADEGTAGVRAAFVAGIIEGVCDGAGFPTEGVTAHSVGEQDEGKDGKGMWPGKTVFLIKFKPEVLEREEILSRGAS